MGPQQDPKKPHSKGSAAAAAAGRKAVRYRECRRNRYRECRRNHAASIGGYAVEGYREFMAAGEEGTPTALLCATCSCHHSFHNREVDHPPDATAPCDCSSVFSYSRRS